MLIGTTIKEWRTDGGRRVHNKTTGQYYLLNHKYMFEIHSHTDGSWFYYSDNTEDSRERPSYVKTTTTVTHLIEYGDRVPWHQTVKLPVFPDGDVNATKVATTIALDDIVKVVDHEKTSLGHSFVTYREEGFDLKTVRVDATAFEILAYFTVNSAMPT
jgi:hypothetical protein